MSRAGSWLVEDSCVAAHPQDNEFSFLDGSVDCAVSHTAHKLSVVAEYHGLSHHLPIWCHFFSLGGYKNMF